MINMLPNTKAIIICLRVASQPNLQVTPARGIKKLGIGRNLSVSRYRYRKGLPSNPTSSGLLTDGPDWSYPDGTPGYMNKGQTMRYQRDQNLGRNMLEYMDMFKPKASSG